MADITVELAVTGAAPPDDTWKPAKKGDSDENDGFWYKFTGGNTGLDDGSWKFDTDSKEKDVEVKLAQDTAINQFKIMNVTIEYDGTVPDNKKDVSIKSQTDTSWILKDKNKNKESGEFGVVCSYTNPEGVTAPTNIRCDPGWRND